MKANELEEYSAKELDRLAREREEAIKAKGGLPYLGSLAVGESRILLMPKVPLDNPDKDGRPRKDHGLSSPKVPVILGGQTKPSRSSHQIPVTVCRQEAQRRTGIRMDRQHQIAPLPRPPRL